MMIQGPKNRGGLHCTPSFLGQAMGWKPSKECLPRHAGLPKYTCAAITPVPFTYPCAPSMILNTPKLSTTSTSENPPRTIPSTFRCWQTRSTSKMPFISSIHPTFLQTFSVFLSTLDECEFVGSSLTELALKYETVPTLLAIDSRKGFTKSVQYSRRRSRTLSLNSSTVASSEEQANVPVQSPELLTPEHAYPPGGCSATTSIPKPDSSAPSSSYIQLLVGPFVHSA